MPAADYDVRFYRYLVNSMGQPQRSCLSTVRIRDCRGARHAGLTAMAEFERRWSLYQWSNLAQEVEVSKVPGSEGSAGAS